MGSIPVACCKFCNRYDYSICHLCSIEINVLDMLFGIVCNMIKGNLIISASDFYTTIENKQ
jgi:hypothetical protein